MKKIYLFLVTFFVALAMSSCSLATVDGGEDDEYFTIKKFTGSLDDREVTLFQRYTEVDNDVWEDYLEKYNLSMEYNKGLFKF